MKNWKWADHYSLFDSSQDTSSSGISRSWIFLWLCDTKRCKTPSGLFPAFLWHELLVQLETHFSSTPWVTKLEFVGKDISHFPSCHGSSFSLTFLSLASLHVHLQWFSRSPLHLIPKLVPIFNFTLLWFAQGMGREKACHTKGIFMQ